MTRHLDLEIDPGIDLAVTCGPVAWGRGRWPDVDWVDGALLWVGREGEEVVHRLAHQAPEGVLVVEGSASAEGDAAWARAVLGLGRQPPIFTDPVLAGLAAAAPGLRPWSAGSLFEGLVTSIVGQSITVAAAAVTVTRLAALFHDGIEIGGRRLRPLPTPSQLATADPAGLRPTGVTWRRAGALIAVGHAALSDDWPADPDALAEPDRARALLRRLPLVGPWTSESALLWGVGAADVHPTHDAALLRAARLAYDRPDLDHRALDAMAESWRPNGGWASRLLWHRLMGPAPPAGRAEDPASAAAPADRSGQAGRSPAERPGQSG